MRDIPSALAAHIEAAATTLCHCWSLTRRDGLVLGFTDHDRKLSFEGVDFAATTGLEAAESAAELGFAIGGGEVAGAFAALGLNEADLARGLYDDAGVRVWLINWADPGPAGPAGRRLRRRDQTGGSELHGRDPQCRQGLRRGARPAVHALLLRGSRRCALWLRARRGGSRCRRKRWPPVALGRGHELLCRWSFYRRPVGLHQRRQCRLRHRSKATRQRGRTGTVPALAGTRCTDRPSDGFRVTPGCDKSFATCRAKFGNGVNFRGFPHMPTTDFIIGGVRPGDGALDGGSLFR